MTRRTSVFGYVFLILSLALTANAQTAGTIAAGTQIVVRTNEAINADDADGRVFSGIVEQDVKARNGSILIPRRSDVELVVNQVSDNELAVDLESITVNGQRYSVATGESNVTAERQDGIGANKRTATHVGGGALAGAIIGAIAGGGKGAAIGAGVGAAAGAGVQVLTRGDSVRVPAESLLTFQLQQPIRTGAATSSIQGQSTNSAAYRDGLRNGELDAEQNLDYDERTTRWTRARDRRDYEAGYDRGYNAELAAVDPNYDADARVLIGRDNRVTWSAPFNSRLYVRVDNNEYQLFAEGPSGTQPAPWIEPGHFYLFVLQDMNGREIARDTLDTRNRRR